MWSGANRVRFRESRRVAFCRRVVDLKVHHVAPRGTQDSDSPLALRCVLARFTLPTITISSDLAALLCAARKRERRSYANNRLAQEEPGRELFVNRISAERRRRRFAPGRVAKLERTASPMEAFQSSRFAFRTDARGAPERAPDLLDRVALRAPGGLRTTGGEPPCPRYLGAGVIMRDNSNLLAITYSRSDHVIARKGD